MHMHAYVCALATMEAVCVLMRVPALRMMQSALHAHLRRNGSALKTCVRVCTVQLAR